MKQFLAIFNKVGGMEILRQYWRGHVLLFALVQTALLGLKKKSLGIKERRQRLLLQPHHRKLQRLSTWRETCWGQSQIRGSSK
jgi:hypothetical protein